MHLQERLAGGPGVAVELERDGLGFLRSDLSGLEGAFRDGLAFNRDAPAQREPAQVGEPVLVADRQPVAAEGEADGLLHLAALKQRGVGGAVGGDQAVAHKLVVVDLLAEVAAVGIPGRSVAFDLFQAVVDPFPDEAALQAFVRFEGVPVLLQAAVAVAHGVLVFAGDVRARVVVTRAVGDHRRDLRVHGAEQVAGVAVASHRHVFALEPARAHRAFVVQGAAGVVAADPGGHGVVVLAVAGFVSEGPHNDAGVVFRAFDHVFGTVHKCVVPTRVAAQRRVVGVGLDIGLVDHVQAVLIAQRVPARVVGVVGVAHGVEVVLLHQPDVLDHVFAREGFGACLVVFVAVHAADHDRGAVDHQLAVGGLDALKAHAHRGVLDGFGLGLAFRVAGVQRHGNAVERGRLGGPRIDLQVFKPDTGAVSIDCVVA